jgi:ATP-dependent protease Clp ATPase subunit
MRAKNPRLACSFCGKKASEVAKLVSGARRYFRPTAYICDSCIAVAVRIMKEADASPEPASLRPGHETPNLRAETDAAPRDLHLDGVVPVWAGR